MAVAKKKTVKTNEKKTLEDVQRDIAKKIPGVRIYRGSSPEAELEIQEFGITPLDKLCRGMLCGGYTILWGPDKSGKSTLMARAMAQMQRDGRTVLLVDLESRMDPEWLKRQGVSLDDLYIQRGGDNLEANLDAVNAWVREGVVDAVCIDSISAQAPSGEMEDKSGKEKSIKDDTVALLARKLSQWFRIFTTITVERKVPVVLLSQTRTTNLHAGAYQDMSGGRAPKHWGSTTVKCVRSSKIEMTQGGQKKQLGFWLRCTLDKTSLCANEGQQVLLPFYFGIGVDDVATAVRAGIQDGIILQGATSAVVFNGKTYRSENQLVQLAHKDAALAEAIRDAVASMGLDEQISSEPSPEPDSDRQPATKTSTIGDNSELEYVCKINDCGQVCKSKAGLSAHQRSHK
jgi:recombination protein RecA